MSESNLKLIYVTQYALTTGIFTAEASVSDKHNVAVIGSKPLMYLHGLGKTFCYTEEDALKIAEEMRVKRIASLERSIVKLKKMKFVVKDGR